LLLLAGLLNVNSAGAEHGYLVAEALVRLQHALEQAGAEVTIPGTEPWPTALGHPAWVEEVWVNYISNACKYGRVDSQPPRITLGADLTGFQNLSGLTMCRFWVRDYGIGVTPADQVRLFTPFTRLDQVRARGHGLGLSIVRRIVEKLGGDVVGDGVLTTAASSAHAGGVQ
jgi:signal transduction histidine kinase